jgi:hypothetical protein
MTYDSTRFTLSNVNLGSLVASNFSGSYAAGTAGQLTGQWTTKDLAGVMVGPGQTGSLLTFTLTALSAGSSDLNLVPQISNTSTDVVMENPNTFDFPNLVLSPPVTSGFDPGVDSHLTVTGTPEPSSWILGLVVVTVLGLFRSESRRRRRATPAC